MNDRKLSAVVVLLGLGIACGAPAAAEECSARLDAIRTMQAQTAYLDANRPDLVQLRRVAQDMQKRGREQLCLELVNELEALIEDHRAHVDEIDDLANFAAAMPVMQYQGELNSERLVGMAVRNPVGKELGEVKGLEIATGDGRISAIQVAHGGFLGLGEKVVRIPWAEVRMSVDGSAVVLNMNDDAIEQLPAAE